MPEARIPRGLVVYLDRDGTLNEDVSYLRDARDFELLPHTAAGLRHLKRLGATLVVVTNQSAIGRGMLDEAGLARIHDRMRALLHAENTDVDAIYVCPHHPDVACPCRKPAPGLVRRAEHELGLFGERAFVIGDKGCDIDLGRGVGAVSILVRTGYGAGLFDRGEVVPDYCVEDLGEAAHLIDRLIHEGDDAG